MYRPIRVLAGAFIASLLLVVGACGSSDDKPEASPATSATPSDSPSTEGSSDSGDGCWVHLFDGDNFDESDDNLKLTEAGEYENLENLPGADKDWTDEADSIKVGSSAKVEIFDQRDFKGKSQTLEAGSEHPDVDDEPYSLKMTCN